jgi:hypothetical protein
LKFVHSDRLKKRLTVARNAKGFETTIAVPLSFSESLSLELPLSSLDMKATTKIRLVALVAALVALPGIAGAQNTVQPALDVHAADAKATTMSFDRVRSITTGAVREAIGNQLGAISAEDIAKKLEGSFDALRNGSTVGFHTTVSSLANHSITEQHVMQVKVAYEPRPIGGILTVRVELVPVFAGIGSASRPTAVREVSQAVDNFDEDAIGEMVAGLSHEIGQEYAAK